MNKKEKFEKTIIKIADQKKEFVTDVDGFIYWWPEGRNGHLAACHLRAIADELDKRNEKWQKEIDDFFKTKNHE